MIDDLAGKVAVVTGAAQGIGLTVAKELLAKGAKVYLADIEGGDFGGVAETYGVDKAIIVKLDVTIPESWSALHDTIEGDCGHLDILVNNAGISPAGSIESTDFELWRKVISVNLDSVFLGCNTLLPLLKKSSSASIINLSSLMGIKSDANLAAYSASKGGVRLLTKSIALHGAQFKIRCNSVHPGGVRTRMLDEFIKTFGDEEEAIKLITANVPLATVGEPEDISNMILFLASDASKWITGAEMCVDGGSDASMSGVAGSDPCVWAESHDSRKGVQREVDSEKEACHVTSHYLWSMSEECLDDVAMVFHNGPEVTYRDLQERTKKVVLILQGLGLKKGDVVSAQLPNWEEFAYINLACCTLGFVFNPIIPIYRGKELNFILADAGTKLLFIPDEYRSMGYVDMVKELAPKIESLEHVVVLRSEDASKLDGIFKSYELLVQGVDQSSEFSIPESPDADHVKLLMYTSGTTGTPKGVLHSHRTMATVVNNIVNFRKIDEFDVYYMPSPVTHITGYSACEMIVRTPLNKTVIQDKWNKSDAVDFILKTGATFTVGATPFLVEILDECRRRKETLPTLKSFACGGASVPPELIRSVSDVLENCQAFRVYGSTEVPLVSQGLTSRSELERAATTDGCIYNYDVKVIDENGDDVTAGERDGEFLVKGPGMLLGYTSLEQTEKAFDASGYFHTGDIGHVSSNDDIVITDRMKDIIIRGGENISAKEVEDVLHEHENIREAAVVSQPNERLGEGVCAFIIPVSDVALTLEEVNQYLRQKGLANQKQLENMIIVDSFERTASGKIRKDILRNITWKK